MQPTVLEWPVETIHGAVRYLGKVMAVHGTDHIADVAEIVERHTSNALRIWSEADTNDAAGLNVVWVARGICQFQRLVAELWSQAIDFGVEEQYNDLVEELRGRFKDKGDWLFAADELAVRTAELCA